MVGDSPLYVRRVGERHKIVRQTDSGFGVDARACLGSPLSPEALLNSSLPHDLDMGGMAHAGSRQFSLLFFNFAIFCYFPNLKNDLNCFILRYIVLISIICSIFLKL